MLGRRLDRYIGLFFVWHFVLCLLAIVVLYVILDTFAKLEDFMERESVGEFLRWIVIYHAYQVPVLLTQFLPLVTLLSGVLSITRLARYNELNAIKAVGVSLHRALAPMFLCALAVGVLAAANQELLVPSLAYDITEMRARAPRRDVYRDLSSFDEKTKATVWVHKLEYALPGFELSGVQVGREGSAGPRPKGQGPARKGEGPGPRTGDGLRVRGAEAVWVGCWLFLSKGEVADAKGRWQPFEHMAMATKADSTTYTMPQRPKGADAPAPVVRLHAERDGRPVEVAFSTWRYKGAFRLILGGQLTAPLRSGEGSAPIAIHAAVWNDAQRVWLGRAYTYEEYPDQDGKLHRDTKTYDGQPLPLTIAPRELIKSQADPTLKSLRELLRYENDPPALRQKKLVIIHSRLAFPLASFVLLLVAVPLLFQQEGGKSTWVGLGLALLVCMCFYVVNYLSQLSGQSPDGVLAGVPALAAWLPVAAFAALGGVLTARMKT